jgi:RNA-binding protein
VPPSAPAAPPAPAPPPLTGKQRRFLRALAHPLDPIVQIGVKGLGEAVLAQLDVALRDHELVKVKVGRECPDDKPAVIAGIERSLRANVVQSIGRILVVFRKRDEDSRIDLPPARSSED